MTKLRPLAPLLLLVALSVATGCRSAAASGLTAAQQVLSGYSLHARGEFRGELAMNGTYAAIDAQVDAVLSYRAPLIAGGEPVVVWTKEIARSSGQRAYKVVFSATEGTQFVQIFESSWAEARVQLPFLSPPSLSVEAHTAAASPKILVEEPRP